MEFDENGNKIKEGFYKEGKLEGAILNYNKLGKVLSKLIYEDGLLIDAIPYQYFRNEVAYCYLIIFFYLNILELKIDKV